MSKDRQAKKRREEEKARRVRDRKMSMLEALFAVFGLQDRFATLPPFLLDHFILQVGPMPQVEVDGRLTEDDDALDVAAETAYLMDQDWDLSEIGIPVVISLATFLRVWINLDEALRDMARVLGRRIAERKPGWSGLMEELAIVKEVRAAMAPTTETYNEAAGHLFSKITTPAMRRSSPCERLYWTDFDGERTPGGRIQATLRVMRHIPESIRVPTPTGERRAFELVRPIGPTCEPVRWDRAEVGLEGPGRVPVLVLRHAVERLEERIPFRGSEHVLHSMMLECLGRPRIARRTGDTLLVEFGNKHQRKYGYFVAELISGVALVRTFKFLTMQGTPESDELRRALRLHRRDIEYLKLDSLDGLTCSDIEDDPVLSRIFTECGCGHLISLFRPELRSKILGSSSFDVRRYLGIAQVTSEQTPKTPPGVQP